MVGHPRENPLDRVLSSIVGAMSDVDKHLERMSDGVPPFDSKALTPEEEHLLFMNPRLRYQQEVDPVTGQAMTNAQSSARYLQDVGAVQYVAEIDDYVRRADRRGQEGPVDG